MTTFWANACVLFCLPQARHRWLHLCYCIMAAAAVAGADSVTSKLACLALLLLVPSLHGLWRRGAGVPVYLGAVALGGFAAVLYKLVESTISLRWLFGLLGRDAELTGRANVWADAWTAIGARPLLGWSFDDHAYLIASAGMSYSSYHNGWLDLAVNGGAAAVLLLALVLLFWAADFLHPHRLARVISPCTAAYVPVYLMHNITEASLVSPRGQMWVIFLVLLCVGASHPLRAGLPPRPGGAA
jgi:O-antigen ligase